MSIFFFFGKDPGPCYLCVHPPVRNDDINLCGCERCCTGNTGAPSLLPVLTPEGRREHLIISISSEMPNVISTLSRKPGYLKPVFPSNTDSLLLSQQIGIVCSMKTLVFLNCRTRLTPNLCLFIPNLPIHGLSRHHHSIQTPSSRSWHSPTG